MEPTEVTDPPTTPFPTESPADDPIAALQETEEQSFFPLKKELGTILKNIHMSGQQITGLKMNDIRLRRLSSTR